MQNIKVPGEPSRLVERASTTASPIIAADRISFAYGKNPVLRGVSLALPTGAMAAVIGPNGSGKSTLIRLLAGLLKPNTGSVEFDGKPLNSLSARNRAQLMAYVPQSSNIVFPFSALEVVLTGRSPYTGRFELESSDSREIALEALAAIGAAHLADKLLPELSGGERQLVAVARALAQTPRLLLLDEPSSALDLKHRAGLVTALARLSQQQKISVLMISHDLTLLDDSFQSIFAMKGGELMTHGEPSQVLIAQVLTDLYDTPVSTLRHHGKTLIWSAIS